jgi:hypothetical protein
VRVDRIATTGAISMIAANKDTSAFLFDHAGEPGSRSVVSPRNSKEAPLNPSCPIHLRRICGVCAFFDGDGIRSRGHCQKFDQAVNGPRSAADCAVWTRKSAQVSA